MGFEFPPDPSLGNKFFGAQMANDMNGATRSFLTTSGIPLLDFGGGNADEDEVAWSLQVPEDYIDTPQFYVRATSPASAGTFQLEMDLAAVDVGGPLNVMNDGGLGPKTAAGPATSWDMIEFGPFVPATAVLVPGKMLLVRIFRDASDAADTANNVTLSVAGLRFTYRR